MSKGKANQAEKDAAILFPERELIINDELITVNEIKFTQGLQFGSLIKPMISAMSELFGSNGSPEFDDISDIFGANDAAVKQLMAATTGKDIVWINDLSDTDGQNLMMTFWAVNSDFFTRRIVSKSMVTHLKSQQSQPASPLSSAH